MVSSGFTVTVFTAMGLVGAGANLAVPGLNTAFGMVVIALGGGW